MFTYIHTHTQRQVDIHTFINPGTRSPGTRLVRLVGPDGDLQDYEPVPKADLAKGVPGLFFFFFWGGGGVFRV